jgi:Fe2+ transport system protein FeoA
MTPDDLKTKDSAASHREELLSLGQMKPGETGTIVSVGNTPAALKSDHSVERRAELTRRLMHMGFVEGATFEIALQAPFSRDPIAVRVRGALIALRRNEADLIRVKRGLK